MDSAGDVCPIYPVPIGHSAYNAMSLVSLNLPLWIIRVLGESKRITTIPLRVTRQGKSIEVFVTREDVPLTVVRLAQRVDWMAWA